MDPKTMLALAESGKMRHAFALRILAVGRPSVPLRDAPAGSALEYAALANAGVAHIEGDKLVFTADELPHGAAFSEAWHRWQAYRRERKKQLTAMSRVSQLTELATVSESEAVRAINESIKNGWTGLFPRKENDNGRKDDGTKDGEFAYTGRRADEV
ncbi:MAG: hypothetical protein AAB403_07715 [Planctomycetota bacterium]